MRALLRPSPRRARLLRGLGTLLIGLILAKAAIIGPAWACERNSLLEGGDMIPGFCADYGAAAQGWPMLLAGLALVAIGLALVFRTAADTRYPTVLRAALGLAVVGATVVFLAWSTGARGTCMSVFDADVPMTCVVTPARWQPFAYVVGGAMIGAGAALAAGTYVRSRTFADG